MKGMAAPAGRGRTRAVTPATTPHQIAITADERTLSPALLTSEFHSA